MNYNNNLLHEKTLKILCDAILTSYNNDVYQVQNLFQKLNFNVDLTRSLFLVDCLNGREIPSENWQIDLFTNYGRYGYKYMSALINDDLYINMKTLNFHSLKMIIKQTLSPINFVDREYQLNTLVDTLNKYLIYDKLRLSYKGTGVILHKNNQVIQLFRKSKLAIMGYIKAIPISALKTVQWCSEFLKNLHFIIITIVGIIAYVCYGLIH